MNLASESLVRDEAIYMAVKKKVMTDLALAEKEEKTKKKKKVATPPKKGRNHQKERQVRFQQERQVGRVGTMR